MLFGRRDAKGSEPVRWVSVGAPRPGTEAAVEALDRGEGRPDSLVGVDACFDASAFLAWTQTVFDRSTAAWKAHDPEPLRAVMDAAVWDAYARHLLGVGAMSLMRNLMSAARATPSLAGTAADGGQQSALVAFQAAVDPVVLAASKYPLPADGSHWEERWLFQRDAAFRTHPSGAVAVCPVCGAPAEPEETGRCRYCHSDITTRTSGWMVTRTATTATTLAQMDERAATTRERMVSKIDIPPAPVVAAPLQPPRAAPPA